MHSFFVNSKEWEKLPKQYQAAFEAAAYEAKLDMMASYDFKNPFALRSLVGKGVQLRSFSSEIMKAAQSAGVHHLSNPSTGAASRRNRLETRARWRSMFVCPMTTFESFAT